jgi:hypothetical protein
VRSDHDAHRAAAIARCQEVLRNSELRRRTPPEQIGRRRRHDEAIRAELDRLGLKPFQDVRATVRVLLDHLPGSRRAAFSASIAERLLREHEAHPDHQRLPYVLQWRPALNILWAALARPDRDASDCAELAKAVGAFYLSPAYQDRKHDDVADAADHAAMAALYAAECYLHGGIDFAAWAGWRGFDAATIIVGADREWPHRRPPETTLPAWELAHPAIQTELDEQLCALELLGDSAPELTDDVVLERLRHPAQA